jgi:hypothetical protein
MKGVSVDSMSASEWTTIQGKNFTTYTEIGGRNVTFEGKTPSNEFIDITHFIDWLHAEIQQDVWDTLAANEKLPFTDEGIQTVVAAIEGALRKGVQRGGLKKDPMYAVTAPKVADVSLTDRANRKLPDIAFTAELAGAIHRLVIRGKVTV